MVDKKHIIIFITVIVFFSLAFQYMCGALSGDKREDQITQFLVNLPPCFFVGVLDFRIVRMTYTFRRNNNTYLVIAINLFLTALCAALLAFGLNILLAFFSAVEYEYNFGVSSLPLVMWNCIVVLLIEIFFFYKQQMEAERQIAIIEKEKIKFQYETLKAQINPHFLFNSLNTLSSLAYESAEKTNLFAKKMSGIFRYLLLTSDRPTVSLKEELAFLDSYIFLEQIRFEGALFVEVDNHSGLNREVIPVSLQLLVENAIKHNITTSSSPLTVHIHIDCVGITVSNNLQLRNTADKVGVGLKNLQKQYMLHHKTISISKTETEFIVRMPFVE